MVRVMARYSAITPREKRIKPEKRLVAINREVQPWIGIW
jgi:hypothetical protein